jgi:hypothetical protein
MKQFCRPCSQVFSFPAQSLRSIAFWWQGTTFFCEQVPKDLVVHSQVGVDALQMGIFLFQLL